MANDWYEIMELSPGASSADIEKQYLFLCRVWSPDRFSDNQHKAQAKERMRRINAAYAVLSDPRKRADYDGGRASQAGRKEEQRQSTQTHVNNIEPFAK